MRDFSINSDKLEIKKCLSCGRSLSEYSGECFVCFLKKKNSEPVVENDKTVIYRENICRCLKINKKTL